VPEVVRGSHSDTADGGAHVVVRRGAVGAVLLLSTSVDPLASDVATSLAGRDAYREMTTA